MSSLGRMVVSLWHSRWHQLAARLRLTLQRNFHVQAARVGIDPGRWYRAAALPMRIDSHVRGPVIRRCEEGNSGLPLEVDLAGTRWTVGIGMDWNPKSLDRGTRLEKLNLHYMEYLAELRHPSAVALMDDWAQHNPPYQPGYWKDAWNSYALSIRTAVWIDTITEPDCLIDDELRGRINQSLTAQIRFLCRNLETDIGGNHLMKNLRALLRAGAYFKGTEADSWRLTGMQLLRRELAEQVLPDGMHFELSPSYHLQVMEDLLDMRRVVSCTAGTLQSNAPLLRQDAARTLELLDNALHRMAIVSRRLTHPDGMPSLFGDGGLHMATPTAMILRALAETMRVDEIAMREPDGAWSLPDAGYFGLTTGSSLFVVDCGPVGARHLPAHGHGDALAIEWTVRGCRVLVDSGVTEYHAGPRRAYSRSTIAHNTLSLDDADQSEFWSAFRVARRANAVVREWQPSDLGFSFSGEHDGYKVLAGHPVHVRSIAAHQEKIRVVDEVSGGAGQAVRSRLLLGPDVRVAAIEPMTNGEYLVRLDTLPTPSTDGKVLAPFSLLLKSTSRVTAVPAVWMPDFGVTQDATMLVFECGAAPCRSEWWIEVV